MIIIKVISALMAFLMSVLPFGSSQHERRCNPEFNGTFIQSWMSGSWDDERWQTEIENMKEAGIEYLILQDVAEKSSESLGGNWNVYYDSELPVFENAVYGGNVIEKALRNCEGSGIKVFVGLAMFDDFWSEAGIGSLYQDVCRVAGDMMEDIYNKYGEKYKDSLYGWYYTPEISNGFLCQFTGIHCDHSFALSCAPVFPAAFFLFVQYNIFSLSVVSFCFLVYYGTAG